MQQSQQAKGHSLLEVMVVQLLLRLLATTALDGADWMICYQLDDTIVQSLMVIKFMLLEEMEQGQS